MRRDNFFLLEKLLKYEDIKPSSSDSDATECSDRMWFTQDLFILHLLLLYRQWFNNDDYDLSRKVESDCFSLHPIHCLWVVHWNHFNSVLQIILRKSMNFLPPNLIIYYLFRNNCFGLSVKDSYDYCRNCMRIKWIETNFSSIALSIVTYLTHWKWLSFWEKKGEYLGESG